MPYSHLGAFMNNAPCSQKYLLWEQVAIVMLNRISDQMIWPGTAGDGVPWRHVRLDNAPKYYRYTAYRNNT